MSNDKYQRLRDALAAGPTPGPWKASHESCDDFRLIGAKGVYIISGCGCCGSPSLNSRSGDADANYIAAADPDTITALLAERDALREAAQMLIDSLGGLDVRPEDAIAATRAALENTNV